MIRKQTRKWTMRDGGKIRVCDMSDSHLKNTLAMLERYGNAIISNTLLNFPNFNGEMAQYYAEQEYDRTINSTPMEIAYEILGEVVLALESERDRRDNLKRLPTFQSPLQRAVPS